MSNDDWGTQEAQFEVSLKSIPDDWSGYTREEKVNKLNAIIQHQQGKVYRGTFKLSDAPRVAALILDAQMEMAEFMADAEAFALNMKHEAEFIEAEKITSIGKELLSEGKKTSENALKRVATISDEVKTAKKTMIEANREYKKWKGVHDMLNSAHVFFRNLSKT